MMEADVKNVNAIQTDISGEAFDNLLTNESVSIVTHIKNTWMSFVKNYFVYIYATFVDFDIINSC